jgi:hypothetical protein
MMVNFIMFETLHVLQQMLIMGSCSCCLSPKNACSTLMSSQIKIGFRSRKCQSHGKGSGPLLEGLDLGCNLENATMSLGLCKYGKFWKNRYRKIKHGETKTFGMTPIYALVECLLWWKHKMHHYLTLCPCILTLFDLSIWIGRKESESELGKSKTAN